MLRKAPIEPPTVYQPKSSDLMFGRIGFSKNPGDVKVLFSSSRGDTISSFKMDKNQSIYVAGHRGMVGSAVVRRLQRAGFNEILTRSRSELDLLAARRARLL